MGAQCLSCAAGQTLEEYCKENPLTVGCPEPTVNPPKLCCRANTAECLSCAAGQTVEEYCKVHMDTVGCQQKPKPQTMGEPCGWCINPPANAETCGTCESGLKCRW